LIPDSERWVRIPEQLATHQCIDPAELSPPVGDVIDLEALERTVSTARSGKGSTASTVTVEAADSIDVTADGYQSIMTTESARSRLL